MEAYKALLTRRSIRKYEGWKIPKELVNEILKAAMYAPSAKNQQPWCFLAVDERKILDRIPAFHPYANMLKQASLALLVCCDKNLIKSEGYWIQDCSAATENILIASHDQGIGSVWLGVYPREDRVKGMRNLFKLPENIIPFSLISLGYPDEIKQQPERFDEKRIHWNKW